MTKSLKAKGKSKNDAASKSQNGKVNAPKRTIGGIPENYFDLLRDVVRNESNAPGATISRPLKMRKTRRDVLLARKEIEVIDLVDSEDDEDDYDDENEDDEFEEVDLDASDAEESADISNIYDLDLERNEKTAGDDSRDLAANSSDTLVLDLGTSTVVNSKSKRKGTPILSKAEKHQRLLFHKFHLICLLNHVHSRNKWCNDFKIRKHYKRVLPASVMKELHPASHLSPTLKTRKLLDGLRHASTFWNEKFKVTNKSTRHGLLMLSWAHMYERQRIIDNKVDLDRFRNNYLLRFRGNRDIAAQGFCAVLRAANIDARLVCSLQPMDYKSNTPIGPPEDEQDETPEPQSSNHPVFWVEVWNKFENQWISVDPICLRLVDIIGRKSKFEPPAADGSNSMRYVIAFDQDGKAVDVTRRYANFYNARTRKKRVDSTAGGEVWWAKALAPYKRRHSYKRDILEQELLARREASEDIPTNVQDFKGHPLFVLEQHLKQNELLDPKIPVGALSLRGSNAKPTGVQIYRRKDVKTLKSAQNWYKMGRIIKTGSQPLKMKAPVTKKRKRSAFSSDDEDSEESGVPLYSEDQTELYVPPPVVNGIVPKNRFKNIDIYCASMIPEGAVHLPYANINIAARLVEVDYADAVTGFDFQNRRTIKPHVSGIVVAKEYEEAVKAVYDELVEEQKQEDERIIRVRALIRWRKYLIALRIKDRLNREHGVVTTEHGADGTSPGHETISLSSDSRSSSEPIMSVPYEAATSLSPLASEPELPQSSDIQSIVISDSDNDVALLRTVHRSVEDQQLASAHSEGTNGPTDTLERSKDNSDSEEFMAESMSESELY